LTNFLKDLKFKPHRSLSSHFPISRQFIISCSEIQKVRVGQSHIRKFAHRTFSYFSKVRLCDRTFCHTFQKCDCAIALFFALFKSATNRTIALSKSANVRKCAKKCEFSNPLFPHFKKSDRTISKCAIAHSPIAQFCTFQIVRSHFFRNFQKCGKSLNCTFKKSECAKMCKKVRIFKSHFFAH